MNIILLGAPGCGKGTQGAILAKRKELRKVATGDLLRAAVRDESELGTQARAYMDQGLLVPDDIMIGLIQEVLEEPESSRGIVMDGFPRTVAQAEAVDRLLETRGAQVDHVIHLVVPEQELTKRLLGRASQQGRSDDKANAIKKRLEVYERETEPLINYYRNHGTLSEVPGVGSIEDIAARVWEILQA